MMLFGSSRDSNMPVLFGGSRRQLPSHPLTGGGTLRLNPRPILGSYKKGGKVKKTGLYMLHKGETVKKATLKAKVRATMAKS